MLSRHLSILAVIAVALLCSHHSDPPARAQGGDISALSDEFGNARTLGSWRHVYQDEGWGANQLERFEIGRGWMTMLPYTSTWYRDYRGVMAYKPVQGDFVITTRVRATGRSGQGAPRSQFSLAGIMVRTPRSITPQTWRPGGENYVFLSLGAANQVGTHQFEVKTTVNSNSQLQTRPSGTAEAEIQVARIGSDVILLTNPGNGWIVFQRYRRNDFPQQLQAGLTCYTDYPTASRMDPRQHNGTVIRNGNPDLLAQFDYVRYRRPNVPAGLNGRALSDARAVSDADLLRFLGAVASR